MQFKLLLLLISIAVMGLAVFPVTAIEDDVCQARLPDYNEPTRENPCIQLIQTCADCTFVNLTFVDYPDNTLRHFNVPMQRNGSSFNATLCTIQRGESIFGTIGNPSGSLTVQNVCFKVKASGILKLDLTNPLTSILWIVFLLIGIILVFLSVFAIGGGIIAFAGIILFFSTDSYIIGGMITLIGLVIVLGNLQR